MVKAAIIAVQNGTANIENRSSTFKMRPEQARAVNMTIDYFNRAKRMIQQEYLNFCGMQKCVLAKLLQHMNLPKR